MAASQPNSRESLKQYCLRRLGKPVINIEIANEQCEDLIDEAFQYYYDFHADGLEEVVIPMALDSTKVRFSTPSTGTFTDGEQVSITSGNSMSTAFVVSTVSNTELNLSGYSNAADLWNTGDIITGADSNATGTVQLLTLGSVDSKCITLDDNIINVTDILSVGTNGNEFAYLNQLHRRTVSDALQSISYGGLSNYLSSQQNLSLVQNFFNTPLNFRYQRHMNRLYIDTSWDNLTEPIIIKGYRIIPANTYTDVYNDFWLKKYITALFKKQWGVNLSKFESVQLPGGVSLNAQKIYDDAITDLEQLETDLLEKYSLPIDFQIG